MSGESRRPSVYVRVRPFNPCLGQFRTALQASALVNSLKLVRCVMQSLQDHQKLNTEIDNTIKTTDALTLAIWEYNIPITKVSLTEETKIGPWFPGTLFRAFRHYSIVDFLFKKIKKFLVVWYTMQSSWMGLNQKLLWHKWFLEKLKIKILPSSGIYLTTIGTGLKSLFELVLLT